MGPLLSLLLMAPDAGAPKNVDAGVRTADAGVTESVMAPVEAKVKALEQRVGEVSARTDDTAAGLKKRVLELETKQAELERQLRQADAAAKRTADELASFRREVNEREEQRQAAERKALDHRQRFDAVTRGLIAVDNQVALGSTGQLNELIRQAEATFSGAALGYVQAAKAALANNDLGATRRYLMLAVFEAQLSHQ